MCENGEELGAVTFGFAPLQEKNASGLAQDNKLSIIVLHVHQ